MPLGIDSVVSELEELKNRVRTLEQGGNLVVPITTLTPEPFDVLKTIHVVLHPSGDEYLASFADANVNACGCNETEAIDNLKDVLIGLFDRLVSLPAKKLGPGPKRQLAVLREFIRKRR